MNKWTNVWELSILKSIDSKYDTRGITYHWYKVWKMINGSNYHRFVTKKVVQPQVDLSIDWQKEDCTTQS